ncbi:hypothetical protein TWF694_010003 [Orbilia ellipsospora]|uniref:Uncharacterized protein n=1 Tax=Orbilia ellipsospora TaxID=2528407 RepID=A0AAV9X8K7_9PEZI
MRHSYGQSVCVRFDPSIHDTKDRVWDESEDIWRANNQMAWLIRKGDNMKVGSILTQGIYISVRESTLKSKGTYTFSIKLWYNGDQRPPRRKEDNVNALAAVDFDLESARILALKKTRANPADGSLWHDVTLSMRLELHSTELTFSAALGDEVVGITRTEYVQSF